MTTAKHPAHETETDNPAARLAALKADRWRRRQFRFRIYGLILMVSGLTGMVVFRRQLFHGNFGVVDAVRGVYRSAQPSKGLPQLIREKHLASVLNLRGGSYVDGFYDAEVRATAEAGVAFYDFPLSAVRRPTRRELLVLIDLFEHCQYPLLIHCKSGSDRTGLATAVYRLVIDGLGPDQARKAFSVEYGHVPLWNTAKLHAPLDEYESWLAKTGQTHTPARFRSWVLNEYRSDDPHHEPPPLMEGPRDSLRRTAQSPAATAGLR